MKALISLILILASVLTAQTAAPAGTITVNAPIPGSFTATAGSVSCLVAGNAVPATAVIVTCTIGAVKVGPYAVPLAANAVYTFDHSFNLDSVAVTLKSSPTGAIAWQASATPSGGTAASGSGNF